MIKTVLERFSEKYEIDSNTGCWNWNASIFNSGYGRFRFHDKSFLAHRFSWILHNEEIPDGLYVCHKCDNRKCVNPEHLFLGDAQDNQRDMREKGRGGDVSGSKNGMVKLTETDVSEIRRLYNIGTYGRYSIDILARKYNVSRTQVSRIVNGKNWKHI